MLGHGVAVVSKGVLVATFADEATAEGFIDANSSRHYVLAVRPLNRIIYEQQVPALLPDLSIVHLVR